MKQIAWPLSIILAAAPMVAQRPAGNVPGTPSPAPNQVGFNVLDFGATCDATNVSDSTAALQAAINAAAAVSYSTVVVPCSINIATQVRVSTKNLQIVGLSGTPLFGTANTFAAINYTGNSAAGAWIVGNEDLYKTAIGTATRATNIVTLSGIASTASFTVGNYLHVTGNTNFNGVDLGPITSKTPTSLTYAQVGANEAVTGGFVDGAWDTAVYSDTADGLTFENLSLSCTSSTTTATDNGLTTYATGARYFTDWRSGGIIFKNVTAGHCAEWFWGLVSDIDSFDVNLIGNHHGIHLDALSSQAQLNIKTSYANDTVVEVNGANGTTFNGKWTSNNDGAATLCPFMIYGTWLAGSAYPGATSFYSSWTENFAGYNGVPAFYCLGTQLDGTASPVQVINTVFYSPELLESFGSPRTAAMIKVDNATGTAVNYPTSDTAFAWPTSVPVITFVTASGSPTAQILSNQALGTNITSNTGLGTPVITKWQLDRAANIAFNATSSGTSPAFAVNSGANTGIGSQASGTLNFIGNAANMGYWNVTGPNVRSDAAYKFHSGTNPASGSPDTALSRPSAGTVSVDTTTIGDGLGTLKLTTIVIAGHTCSLVANVLTCP